MIKQRFFGLLIALISTGVLYWTWYDAQQNGGYYIKAAAFAPLGIVMGIFLIFFPQFSGKPETAREKFITLTVFGIGMLCGLFNWYLIDPERFAFLHY
jgi:hypothetical protein